MSQQNGEVFARGDVLITNSDAWPKLEWSTGTA